MLLALCLQVSVEMACSVSLPSLALMYSYSLCMCVYVCAQEDNHCSHSSDAIYLHFWYQISHWPGTWYAQFISLGISGLNLGPCVYKVSTLTPTPNPQTQTSLLGRMCILSLGHNFPLEGTDWEQVSLL